MSVNVVYLVRVQMSTAMKIESREEETDTQVLITLAYSKDTRDAINRVRGRFRNKIFKPCLSFHGLQIAREGDLDAIRRETEAADIEFKKIDSSLGAQVLFIPLSVDAEARGEVYKAVLDSIRGAVLTALLDRLRELAKLESIPARSRTALIKFADRLKAWNVLDDPDVNAAIDNYKLQFQNDVIAPVLADLERDVAALTSEGAYVEI